MNYYMRAIPKDRQLAVGYVWLGLILILCLKTILQAQIYSAGFRSITADESG